MVESSRTPRLTTRAAPEPDDYFTQNTTIPADEETDNDERLRDFQLIRVIGKGCMGKVLIAVDCVNINIHTLIQGDACKIH